VRNGGEPSPTAAATVGGAVVGLDMRYLRLDLEAARLCHLSLTGFAPEGESRCDCQHCDATIRGLATSVAASSSRASCSRWSVSGSPGERGAALAPREKPGPPSPARQQTA